VLDAARRAGKPGGVSMYPGVAKMSRLVEQGARVLLGSGDEWMLNASCSEMVAAADQLRQATGLRR
jgi:hypothetical protein